MSKSTIDDLAKTAKAASKKGLMKTDNNIQGSVQCSAAPLQSSENALVTHGGKDFFSSFSSEINGIASSTSSMFSDLFGKSKQKIIWDILFSFIEFIIIVH